MGYSAMTTARYERENAAEKAGAGTTFGENGESAFYP